jgi:hypothetical protein
MESSDGMTITREQALANLDRIACRFLSERRGGTWVARERPAACNKDDADSLTQSRNDQP